MSEDIGYIHGYSEEEQNRLLAQNEVLSPYIYKALQLPENGRVVEIGCGVGAQMMSLLQRFPGLRITGVELSPKQVRKALHNLEQFPQFKDRYEVIEADAFQWTPDASLKVDAALMVWVLEHVPDAQRLLTQVRSWIPANCSLWVTEVMHGTFHLWPAVPAIHDYWDDINRCQRRFGGDPDVGSRLAVLLDQAGFDEVRTWANVMFLDAANPSERARLLAYWLELMRSALHEALQAGETTLERWQRAEAGMRAVMEDPQATFFYSGIQAEAKWTP